MSRVYLCMVNLSNFLLDQCQELAQLTAQRLPLIEVSDNHTSDLSMHSLYAMEQYIKVDAWRLCKRDSS